MRSRGKNLPNWMITIESATPSPDSTFPPTLAALSRNASAISTSSSDSTPSAPFLTPRPRPIRTFSGPRSRSPHSLSPRGTRPPHYLARELGYFETEDQARDAEVRAKARSQSRSRNAAVTVEDFRFGKTLGVGSYSTVKLATHLASARVFAIKVIDKGHLIAKKKQQTALAEKDVLKRLGAGHPGIVRMWYTFQDQWCLYFVLDLAKNGEMKILLSRMGSLSLECSRYYSAQLVDIIRYMHSKNVIHRDLKPENLLLDEDFRIKLTDFGTGKVLDDDVDKANTWVGTAQYIAPELLSSKETSKATDFWALGCILYQMISGRFAFQGLSEFLTFEKIKKLEYSFPDGFDESPKNLVQRLLVRDPSARLGVGPPGSEIDFDALTSHPFFASIVWETLWTSQPPALEAGLMKNDNPLAQGHDGNWEGITAAWDDILADDEDDDEEELEWASDARGPRHQLPQINGYHSGFDIGPMDEIRPHKIRNHSRRGTGSTVQGHERETSSAVGITQGRRATSESPFSGSPSSSSEGSPVRNLDTMMESMDLRVSQNPTTSGSVEESPIQEEDERGRKQALSPIQGNGPASNIDFAPLLKLPVGETILFNSTVEARSLRRRASRLIPLPVPPSKRKTRQLILTSNRLLCLKQREKTADISIKLELALRPSVKLKEKDKEKESRGIIASVEPRGEREFVVLTSTKTYSYAANDAELASIWISKINDALASQRQLTNAQT